MIYSMTGYGSASSHLLDYDLLFEVRSVNGRHFDCRMHIPHEFMCLENDIRKNVKSVLTRGSVNVYLSVCQNALKGQIAIDEKAVIAQINQLKKLAKLTDLSLDGNLDTILRIITCGEGTKNNIDLKSIAPEIFSVLDQSLTKLLNQRSKEGKALAKDLEKRLKIIIRETSKIQKHSPKVVEYYKTRITDRLVKLAEDCNTTFDPIRVITEIGVFAEKIDITEELIRLDSHVNQFSTTLEKGGVVGKKLDFLLQEMYREINTIGNKANLALVSTFVVKVKEELEKMREQVQNIE